MLTFRAYYRYRFDITVPHYKEVLYKYHANKICTGGQSICIQALFLMSLVSLIFFKPQLGNIVKLMNVIVHSSMYCNTFG